MARESLLFKNPLRRAGTHKGRERSSSIQKLRMSVLKQDHHAYDAYTVFETILMGNPCLYEVLKQKDALYAKEDFSDADGDLAAELEAEFAELNGWEGNRGWETAARAGLDNMLLYSQMDTLPGNEKVKVLLRNRRLASRTSSF